MARDAVLQPVVCDGMEFASLKEFAYYYGLNYSRVLYYAKRGFTPERIISVCQFSVASKAARPKESTAKRYLCEYEGRCYDSLQEAAIDLGFSPNQLYELRKRNHLSASEAIALAVQRRKESGKRPATAAKPCVVEGVEYPSREAAARAYGVPCITAYSRMEREGISFEEALVRGRNSATYCPPVTSCFSSMQLKAEPGLLRQPILEDLSASFAYYGSQVEPMRDAGSGTPVLRVDGMTYVYFNLDARGLEICTQLPICVPEEDLNELNASYVAAKVYISGDKTYLLTFQVSKEENQDVKTLLTAFYSHVTIRNKIVRSYDK